MVNISKGEVTEFHYSSTMHTAALPIVTTLGTANSTDIRDVRVTDLKMSCGATERTIKILGQGGPSMPLELDLAANTTHNFHWELPYRLIAQASTGEGRSVVASASGAGVKFSISGYIEQ